MSSKSKAAAGKLTSVTELVAAIPDGAKLAVPKDTSGVAMAATRELIRKGVRGLYLVTVPTSGLQADLLIGAGAVETIETSAVTLGEFGAAPRFVAALTRGELRLLDSTCPAIYAALQAGQKGLPFTPLRGLIGSDVLAHRPDWKVIENPFSAAAPGNAPAPRDPIALLPAIRPDVSLFHAEMADRHGNIFVGRDRDLLIMAQASRHTLVTVERLIDTNLLEDEARAGSTLPAIYVDHLAVAPRGSWPLALLDLYPMDEAAVSRYVAAAQTPEGFWALLNEWAGLPLATA
jgi:glutaconate CoA-transferase, subunit A